MSKPRVVWVVEVRMRSLLMNGRPGPWTVWQPVNTFTCDHNSVPAAFHGKQLAKWECKRCLDATKDRRKTVDYRVSKYARSER